MKAPAAAHPVSQAFTAYAMQPQEKCALESYQALSQQVATIIRQAIAANPHVKLGLPTGATPTLVYEILADWSRLEEIQWENVRCFGLDEYIEGPEKDSFRRYLYEHLYKHADIQDTHRFNPLFHDDYDWLIAQQGGLDLTVLGIGTNGHIAFNEPGTPLDSWTHCVSLTEATIAANKKFFSDPHDMPQHAVTMGLRTILASKKIVLMASGERKRAILEQAMHGPVCIEVPASFLQLHENVLVLTDFQE
jgi:glucosamine-6-phosphate deaminase